MLRIVWLHERVLLIEKSGVYKLSCISIAITSVTLITVVNIVLFWFMGKLASVVLVPFSAADHSRSCDWMIQRHLGSPYCCCRPLNLQSVLANHVIHAVVIDMPSPRCLKSVCTNNFWRFVSDNSPLFEKLLRHIETALIVLRPSTRWLNMFQCSVLSIRCDQLV